MTQRATWIGVGATAAIMLVLTVAALREPVRLDDARAEQRVVALQRGMDLYAFNCAECHGSRGQGEIQEDATTLADDYMRSREHDYLYKAIARGRNDTEMAAFHIDEGGALNRQQVESLITVIKLGDWDVVAQRVAALGMVTGEELALAENEALREAAEGLPVLMVQPTPVPGPSVPAESSPVPDTDPAPDSAPPVIDVLPTAASDDALPAIEIVPTTASDDALPVIPVAPTASGTDENDLNKAWGLYALHCAECHGAHGEGVDAMPALDTEAIRAQTARELGRVSFDNAAIDGHDTFFTPDEKVALIDLMLYGFAKETD